MIDIKRVANKTKPQVLASASRQYDEQVGARSFSFTAKSPANTVNAMRILLPAQAKNITLTDSKGQTITDVKSLWDVSSKTLFLSFDNSPDGIKVSLGW
ncbi:hypothetical protein HK413_08185 [Mucilaginibacter sp. S1162]|uniref:Uncharacterized protein n=1 Tax=Mucilaginibacter humi TaxID=2732510 RepID=A0ABX1W3E5_9SPHI|nr:hypothetical protein [Mucilaginibacter humi]NNU34128.1 hypothetical protein [Mucilaginibacter humi]